MIVIVVVVEDCNGGGLLFRSASLSVPRLSWAFYDEVRTTNETKTEQQGKKKEKGEKEIVLT